MTRNGSATSRPETSPNNASIKRRARLLATDGTIPSQTRSLIRYALEINDPELTQLIRRVQAGEMTIDRLE